MSVKKWLNIAENLTKCSDSGKTEVKHQTEKDEETRNRRRDREEQRADDFLAFWHFAVSPQTFFRCQVAIKVEIMSWVEWKLMTQVKHPQHSWPTVKLNQVCCCKRTLTKIRRLVGLVIKICSRAYINISVTLCTTLSTKCSEKRKGWLIRQI